jgi:hypothetical protein
VESSNVIQTIILVTHPPDVDLNCSKKNLSQRRPKGFQSRYDRCPQVLSRNSCQLTFLYEQLFDLALFKSMFFSRIHPFMQVDTDMGSELKKILMAHETAGITPYGIISKVVP